MNSICHHLFVKYLHIFVDRYTTTGGLVGRACNAFLECISNEFIWWLMTLNFHSHLVWTNCASHALVHGRRTNMLTKWGREEEGSMRNMLMKMTSWRELKKKVRWVANEHLSVCISYIPIEMLAFACTFCLCPFPFTLCPPPLRVLPESLPLSLLQSLSLSLSLSSLVFL